MIEAHFMNAANRLVQELNKFREQFKYKYVGGGFDIDDVAPVAVAQLGLVGRQKQGNVRFRSGVSTHGLTQEPSESSNTPSDPPGSTTIPRNRW
jgi:hypothetical protein